MGRPKAKIDEELLAELAAQGASVNEMGLILGVEDETLHRRFKKLIAKKKAERRVMLRNAQTSAARAGNATLLIWLGKQELGQSDEVVTVERRAVEEDTLALREHLQRVRAGSGSAVSNGVGSHGNGSIGLP